MSAPPDDLPDERAIEISRAGLEHLDALYHLARYLTKSREEADDLVQETFARALSGSHTFSRGTQVKSWLFRILRNTFIDQKRRDKVSPFDKHQEAPEASDETRDPIRGDLELDRLRGIIADDIATALRALSDDARTVILLDMEGFEEAELAEILGCAPGTIKSRLSRARAQLRESLREYAK